MHSMRSAFAALVSAARFVTKSFLAVLLFLICLFVGSLLVMVLTDAVGLDDYTEWVLAVVWCVFVFVMIRRGVRILEYQGGRSAPGSDAHTLGLRDTVQNELRRHRRK